MSAHSPTPASDQEAPSPLGTAAQARLRAWLSRPRIEIPLIALAIIATSFAVMCAHLGAKPFWVDESIAVLPAKSIHTTGLPKSPFDLNYMEPQLQDGLWDPSAPLYRYSVAAVTAITGFSETTTRGWSVLLGLLLLVPCHLIFRRVCGPLVAWLAVAFLAALPSYADHCREARHFTFVALLMFLTFYFLYRAGDATGMRARAWWPVLLVATLLGHFIGYLMLPVVGVYVLVAWPAPLLAKRYLWAYALAGAAYATVMAKYGKTLPLFHTIGCENRSIGCHPSPLYYLEILLEFLGAESGYGRPAMRPRLMVVQAISILPMFLLVCWGLHRTWRELRRERTDRAGRALVLAWFLVPLALLSTRELKFDRYLFYVMPPLFLFLARGTVALAGWRWFGRRPRVSLALLTVLVALGPKIGTDYVAGKPPHSSLRSNFVAHALKTLGDTSTDSWERTREQADFLRARLGPSDVVVSAFDDASLTYYLGRFVYGFLNSQHDDTFFTDLLAQTKQAGGHVYFMDSLPRQNHCHTPGMRPLHIDCRKKYPRFYAACWPDDPTYDPTCLREWYR